MNIEKRNLSDLHEMKKNVRKHTDKQLAEYVRSIEMFGQIKPIVISDDGEILAGNGLYRALQSMGRESCDCVVMHGLDEKQKRKLMLADNRVYELGITDTDTFQEIVAELNGDIDIPGWDAELLSVLNASSVDLDEIVTGYGSFDEEAVSKLEERTPRTVAVEEQAAPEKEHEPFVEESKAEPQRYIICPKCGERICL